MPLETIASKTSHILEAVALYGGFALVGGVSRVVLGLDEGETLKGAFCRYMLVALPVGVLTGWGSEALTNHEFFPYAAAYVAGTAAYNVVRYISNYTIKDFINLIKLMRGNK